MKKITLILTALILILSSCNKERIADVIIRYEVEATNTNRSFTMYYANTTFGEDVKRDISSIYYFQEFSIPSDEVPQEYHLSVECLEDRVSNSNQFITTRIYEDGILQVERFSGGTSDIIEDRTYISAFLPTGIKVEEY
ncbi:hypothetical protein N9544_05885 [Flavobacteriales bacterium]|nr:hypothetical protein [Flavobacteriales bacterium]